MREDVRKIYERHKAEGQGIDRHILCLEHELMYLRDQRMKFKDDKGVWLYMAGRIEYALDQL